MGKAALVARCHGSGHVHAPEAIIALMGKLPWKALAKIKASPNSKAAMAKAQSKLRQPP